MKSRTKVIKMIHESLIILHNMYHHVKISSISADIEFVDGGEINRMFSTEKYAQDILKLEQSINVIVDCLSLDLEKPILSKSAFNEIMYDLKCYQQKSEFEETLNYYFDSKNGSIIKEHLKRKRSVSYCELDNYTMELIYISYNQIKKYS